MAGFILKTKPHINEITDFERFGKKSSHAIIPIINPCGEAVETTKETYGIANRYRSIFKLDFLIPDMK
jgi:hypothetical protein